MRVLAMLLLVGAGPAVARPGPWLFGVEAGGRVRLPPGPGAQDDVQIHRWNELGLRLSALASVANDRVRLGPELRAALAFSTVTVLTGDRDIPVTTDDVALRLFAGVRAEVEAWRPAPLGVSLGLWAGAGGTPGAFRPSWFPDFEATALLGVRLPGERLGWTATLSAGATLVDGMKIVPVGGLAVRADF